MKESGYSFDNFLVTVESKIGFPCVVKPNESGSSIGVSIVDNKAHLDRAMRQAFNEDSSVVVEQYIKGREFTCGILGNSGSNEIIALPLVEIVSSESKFFDYNAKYFSENTKEICPANIDQELNSRIQNSAKMVHEILGCDGLTRSDFMLSEENILYFLEINTIPGQTESSLCPKEAKAVRWSFGEFVEKQIKLALERAS